LPRSVQREHRHGSSVRAMFASKNPSRRDGVAAAPLFHTLKGGLGILVGALSSRANVCYVAVETIERRDGGGFRIRANGDWTEADHVIIACPAWAAAQLLASS